jgi:hypothetical protein
LATATDGTRLPSRTLTTIDLGGHRVRVVTPTFFIATKLDAFHGRGGGDVVASHDLEDIIAVVDAASGVVTDQTPGDIAEGDQRTRYLAWPLM